ncbi:uncharacterized protein LOC117580521 isoform X5 [Drosophila guanche]|uniref:uncharacterized protein LOC117580521 isoform X5 n=1 Tax=Drosophila guanche TaxID=7266 RepID=UPI0014723710|nr:uncharacterized protein LOC117580521 isoform X5 [Drosophila guanche]
MSYEAMKRGMQLTATWLCLLATAATFARAQQESSAKWSRQLENAPTSDTDSLDWIPLAQPLDGSGGKDRSGNGRVLTYSQTFPPSARFGELNKPGVAPGSQFDFSYPFPRYSNGQGQALPLPLRQGPPPSLKTSAGQEPTSQSFFKFEMPFHSNEAGQGQGQAQAPPTLQTGYQIQHTFGGGGLQAPSSLFSPPSLFGQQQAQPFGSDFHSLPPKSLNKPLRQQNYIQDILPPKSHAKPTQPSLQSVTPQVFPLDPEPESIFGLNKAAPSSAPATSGGQQEVQLLYVPYDTLYNQQRQQQSGSSRPGSGSANFEVNKFNLNAGLPAVNPYQINQFYTQDPNAGSDFFSSGTTSRPSTTTSQPHSIFQSFGPTQQQPQPQAQTQFSTAKPKPKAHQPPLAMFLLRSSSRPSQSDVVAALRSAHSISVIDSPTKQTPEIFVGPAGMPIPDGYVKFDLPYLSQLAQTRDLSDVSFFVAPLSYRTPNGFNKILLPEPHVGSIVVNRAKDSVSVQTQPPPQRQPQRQPQRPYAAVSSTRNPFETTTQAQAQAQSQSQAGAPVRGNKFSYYYVQDGIQEASSPKIPAKQERHKKKRPQNVQVQHQQQQQPQQPIYRPPSKTQNPFDTLNQIGGDDFFKSLTNKPTTSSSTSTSTTSTSTSTTTSTTAAPTQPLFTYSTRPQVEFPGASGHLYPEYLQPVPEQQQPRLTTRPPTATTVEEEHRMKQYFRQQDAFRQRPLTTIPPAFEQVQYTPSAPDYEVPTTQRVKHKHRVNVYTPAAVPVTTSDVGYQVEQEQAQVLEQPQAPLNHRPSYNQEPREKEQPTITQRRRYKQPFQLEGQESQWSPASDNANSNSNTNTNSFKPLNPKYKTESHNFENEPEIVTVGPTGQPETYEFNVAADLGGSAVQRTTTLKAPNLKPEKSFAELLEEVMGKVPEELATESPNSSSSIGRLNRRGKWKKSRVSSGADTGENFETAESQNLGPQLYNALQAASEKEEQQQQQEKTTTTTAAAAATTEAETTEAIVRTTSASPTTPEEYEVTTARVALEEATMASTLPMEPPESATRRMDTAADVDVEGDGDGEGDLETQPSIFSEVKKQLHDLFAIEESEDEAVNGALAAVGKRRQEYTSIKRTTPATSTDKTTLTPADDELTATATATATTPTATEGASEGSKDNFHKDLMEHVVYATSTSTKVTSETEICYRGRCIRSEDLPANHKLH